MSPAGVSVVLVHGAWADATGWSGVIRRLQAEGYEVVAPQLRLMTLADDVAQVRQRLAEQAGPTILVGHAYGGMVISQIGPDVTTVVALVFIAALATDAGESLATLGTPAAPGAAAMRRDAAGFLRLDPTLFPAVFAGDLPLADAQVLAAVQKPLAEGIVVASGGDPAWRRLPTWYLVTRRDQMIPPTAQEAMAQRAKATISFINGSHAAYISHADEVTDLILRVARAASPHP